MTQLDASVSATASLSAIARTHRRTEKSVPHNRTASGKTKTCEIAFNPFAVVISLDSFPFALMTNRQRAALVAHRAIDLKRIVVISPDIRVYTAPRRPSVSRRRPTAAPAPTTPEPFHKFHSYRRIELKFKFNCFVYLQLYTMFFSPRLSLSQSTVEFFNSLCNYSIRFRRTVSPIPIDIRYAKGKGKIGQRITIGSARSPLRALLAAARC